MSRFEKFYGAATKSGQKVLGSIHPEIVASSTKDKFVLNAVAQKVLGLKTGDYVMLFDQAGEPEATSNEERFFVCKGGVDADGVTHGAKMGKGGMVSYSEIWSAYMMGKLEITSAKPEDLVAAGLAIRTDFVYKTDEDGVEILDKNGNKEVIGGGAYIATQKVIGKLEIGKEVKMIPGEDTDEDGNPIMIEAVDAEGNPIMVESRGIQVQKGLHRDVFAVKNLRVVQHDPRTKDEDVTEDAGTEAKPKSKREKK